MEQIAESNQLQLIFPAEIWLQIGERISKIEDQLHLRDSSQYFRTLFKNLLDQAMFPHVARIIYTQLLKRYPSETSKVMGKCRLVCRHWQENVDAVVQNLPHPLRSKWFGPTDPFIGTCDIILSEGSYNIARFRQHFAKTHAGTKRNPFVRRQVFIHYGSEYLENLIEPTLEFLREYGQHIWHCNIDLRTGESWNIPLIMYRKIYKTLELMPNLLTLSLSCSSVSWNHAATVSDDLKQFFTTHPFPNLEHLKFQDLHQMPTLLSKSLMCANPQITVLHDLCHSPNIETVSFQENLPRLEQLTTGLSNEQQFIALNNLNLNWPLSKLYLRIFCETTTKALFQFLGTRWSATLTQLSLEISKDREFADVVPLQLPNLQVFALTSYSFPPLDFLLPAKYSLKTLSVRVADYLLRDSKARFQSALAAENTVKFLNFRHNLIESNVWTVFPKLRSVDYKDYHGACICQRLDWMLKQDANI